jgi:cytochrome b
MTQRQLIVWDLPLRLFHWSLPVLVAAAWASRKWGDIELHLHFWCGYTILALLLFRLLWGFLGGETARFRNFLKGPSTVLCYLREGMPPTIGHNPLGGWAVLTLLTLLGAQAVSGLFADEGLIARGPRAMYLTEEKRQWFTTAHIYIFDALKIMISLHLSALFVHRIKGDRDIFRGMVTGRISSDQPPPLIPRFLFVRTFICAVISAGCVWATISLI